MTETHETVISSILNSLEIDPEQVLKEEEEDCCPICLEDISKSETNCFFVCCGKSMCEKCDNNFRRIPTKLFSNCPMCRHKVPGSRSETIPWLQKNSNLGKAWAQFQMAGYYESDLDPSIVKNDREALRLYLLSAKQGYMRAQHNLGLMYIEGRGCEKSIKQGVYWFTLAANQGSIEAQSEIGYIIINNSNVVIPGRSKADGIILLHNAASSGDDIAQSRLALALSDSDLPASLYWFKKASLQNYSPAQFYLSITLFDVKQDIPTAMYWLRKAAGSGHKDATNLLKKREVEIALTCASCFKSLNGKGKKCTKCKSVYYCNKECQGNDWKRHKKECVDEIK